jgi:hypothetical protein
MKIQKVAFALMGMILLVTAASAQHGCCTVTAAVYKLCESVPLNALVLTEAINSRMDAYSSTIRLCASTSSELRNFGSTDLPLLQTCTSVLYSRDNCEDFFNSSRVIS